VYNILQVYMYAIPRSPRKVA